MTTATGDDDLISELRKMQADWGRWERESSDAALEILSGQEVSICLEDLAKVIQRHTE